MRIAKKIGKSALLGIAALSTLAMAQVARANGNIIVGTTDTPISVDPAKCYAFYCANILHNVGQTLVTYPSGSVHLKPLLAKSMPKITDRGLTYTFKLRHGVTFQDGSKLTSKDVKFSLHRSLWINHPEGAGFLLSGIDSIDTPDPYTVVVHLGSLDVSFLSKLAFPVATVIPSDAYPSPSKPIPDDAKRGTYSQYVKEKFVGSGPYKIASFRENQSILLKTWDGYWGKKPANNKVLVRFFAKSSQMLVALKSGEIDVAFRHFTPEQRKSLMNDSDIKTIKGTGAAIRFIVFNTKFKPVDRQKVRQAIAATIDRSRIIKNDLGGAARPLYSMLPPAFKASSKPAFKDLYANKKASDYLKKKVKFTLWYSRGHYGDTEPALAQTIKRELEETGLFDVTLRSSEWAEFFANAFPGPTGQYQAFLFGWYPDYLDPDDYLTPFYQSKKQGFLRVYDNDRMNKLLQNQIRASHPNSKERLQTLGKIQTLAAEDAPLLPMYVITPYAFARRNVSGVDKTMGAAQVFHYYVVSKQGD